MRQLHKILLLNIIALMIGFSGFSQPFWRAQTSGVTEDLYGVHFINDQVGWVTGAFGTVLKTTNGGQTWTKLTCQSTSKLSSVYFFNSTEGVAAAWDTVYKTINGGASWSGIWMGTTDVYFYNFFFTSQALGWCAGDEGSVNRSNNGGDFWVNTGTGQTNDVYDVCFPTTDNGYCCGNHGTISYTYNSGTEWWGTLDDHGTTANLYGIIFGDTNTGWVVGDSGIVMKTHNSGKKWYRQNSGFTQKLSDVYFFDTLSGFIAGKGGTIKKTTNGGNSWTTENSTTTYDLNKLFFKSTTKGWAVGQHGTILYYGPAISINESTEINLKTNCYPNPFTKITSISFELNKYQDITLKILNQLGQEVTTICQGQYSPGNYSFNWDAENNPAGIYFYQLQSEGNCITKKLILTK